VCRTLFALSLEGLALSLRRVGFKGADFDFSFSMSSSIFPYCKWWFSKPLERDGFSGATLLALLALSLQGESKGLAKGRFYGWVRTPRLGSPHE
jgi:hypothetical protein